MNKRQFNQLFEYHFAKEKNVDGDACYRLENDGKGTGSFVTRLLRRPPTQIVEINLYYTQKWYCDLAIEISGGLYGGSLLGTQIHIRPHNGIIEAKQVKEAIEDIFAWHNKIGNDKFTSERLNFIYNYDGQLFASAIADYYLCCVVKGNLEPIELELKAQKDGTTKVPPLFNITFFENALRVAKEYQSGLRVCPVDF